ncbi:hypothetical protein AB0N73_04085 [Microbacterium sp. NPDC089189]|uniref:hypothetical protein n=1 Tax=Microbacterium sp. NPDC089189 TaxID=3154972 RepID=UPI00341548C4
MSSRIDQPGRFFTNAELRVIWEATNMSEVRDRHRRGDDLLYRLLTEIGHSAFAVYAVPGHEPRQIPASEERSHWTVEQIAKASRRAARTVRNDIHNNELKATRSGHAWSVPDTAARAYIAGHRRT